MTNRPIETRNTAVNMLKQKFQRVYSGHGFAPAQSQLPCVAVYVDSRRTEPETFDSPPVYRQTVRLVTLVCVQTNIGADELTGGTLSVVQQAFIKHPNLGIDGLENLVPDLLNIDSDDNGEAVTAYYQRG